MFLFLLLALFSGSAVNAGSESRIFDGWYTNIEEKPYMVSILLQQDLCSGVCGGVIISEDWVLTAAQCVRRAQSLYKIRVGSTFRNHGGTIHEIKRIISHPNFRPWSDDLDYDAALIELSQPIDFGPTAQPLPMIEQGVEVPEGTSGQIAGWGSWTQWGPQSEYLLRATVPIANWNNCAWSYTFIRTVTDRMICAGYRSGAVEVCTGDAGGPLVINDKAAGIISWGRGCGVRQYLGVYTKISAIRDWIREQSGV